jgi:hypothetical protein
MRGLVAGWFSFEEMGATAGDLLARDLVCSWLDEVGFPYEVAVASPFEDGISWTDADPESYSHLVFVCGPCGNGEPLTDLLARFESARLVGVDLSMLDPLEEWNPFHVLIERDSSRGARPDITFASPYRPVPVVGRILVHEQFEYASRRHGAANSAIDRLLSSRDAAVVPIDTRLDVQGEPTRGPREVESLIARMDVVVTTRLHGMVLALKHGVPVVAVDPVAGGGKVRRQAEAIRWPVVFTADELPHNALETAFDWCLSPAAHEAARKCAQEVLGRVDQVHASLMAELAPPGQPAR